MNQNQMINDPILRQQQLERCREELKLFEGYCRARQQYGYPIEVPQFNEYGQVVNMPPNLRRLPFPTQPPVFHPTNPQTPHQTQNNSNSFSLCYTLSDDRNSPARQVFEQFQHHPMLPRNMKPTRVIFVYEKQDAQVAPMNMVQQVHNGYQCGHPPQSVDAGVGDYSVVRYNVETQTEWQELEHKGATDNHVILHNAIIKSDTKAPTTTSNLSEPEVPEFNLAVVKVAKWLQMSKNIGDVFNPNGCNQMVPRGTLQQKHAPPQISYHPSPPSKFHKTPFHGSKLSGSGKAKKHAVPSTIVTHSTVELEMETKPMSGVVGDGDDNEKNGSGVERYAEKKLNETNNECLVEGESSVAEKCSASNEGRQPDINTSLSHADVDESEKESNVKENNEKDVGLDSNCKNHNLSE